MATGQTQQFRPTGTVTIAASTTSANVTLPTGGDTCVVYNSGTVLAFVRLDGAGAVATSVDFPVPPGAQVVLDCPSTVTTATAITASSTVTVYFTRGIGSIR